MKGDYLSDCTGMVHEVDYGDDLTSQSVRSVVYVTLSLSLIKTLNPVIGEPPESGIVQLTITLSGIQVVVGAYG